MPREIEPVARALINSKGVLYGEFILASGQPSPFYVDLGKLRSFPDEYDIVVAAYVEMLEDLPYKPDLLVDVPNRATPIVAGIMHETRIPQITPRFEAKNHGSPGRYYGQYEPGMRAVIIDDLITTGGSLEKVFEFVHEDGISAIDGIVLLDRQQGGVRDMRARGYVIKTFGTVPDFAGIWHSEGLITPEQYALTKSYLGF